MFGVPLNEIALNAEQLRRRSMLSSADADSDCRDYQAAAEPKRRTLGTAGLVVIGFFWVSGGIYGNEALVCAAPPAYILLFALVTPLVFSLPIALMTAELSTAFPADGGQVAWVADACGRAVGAHNAYWVWMVNVIDASIYPQLVSEYLRRCLRLTPTTEAVLELGMVVAVSAVSMLGLQWIERSQAVMFVVTMVPCLLFIGFGLPHLQPSHLLVFEGDVDWSLLLSWVLWLYSGVSSLGALAGDVAEPRTTYPRAIGVLLPLVIAPPCAPFCVYLILLIWFHVLEYALTAAFRPDTLSFDNFLLNHSPAYQVTVAMCCSSHTSPPRPSQWCPPTLLTTSTTTPLPPTTRQRTR